MATKDDSPVDDTTGNTYNPPSITDKIEEKLAPLELEAYSEWRDEVANWAYTKGKNPKKAKGYSKKEVRRRVYDLDRFAAWAFKKHGFTAFTPELATEYWDNVLLPNGNDMGSNRKTGNSLQMALRYEDEDWDIPDSEEVHETIKEEQKANNISAYFTPSELDAARHASLRAYAVPRREDMTGEEEEEWTAHLAQRLRKPRHKLDEDDWERANSYKIPSLVYASRDLGFRPCEVERAKTRWFDTDNNLLRLQPGEGAKNGWSGTVPFTEETSRILDHWFDERANNPKYAGTDSVWLTREGNPYSSDSLRHVMKNLMDEAGIEPDDRGYGWYLFRRGVGTEIANTPGCGINEVMEVLRIVDESTARRYIQNADAGVRHYHDSR